ncbi:MAG: sulfatase [Isosphaeraceae bacterium]
MVLGALLATWPATVAHAVETRPNVVWIFVDDMSAQFSCYGETAISTPNVDGLARDGLRFRKAFVTAPVCSPCRSALITGMYQTSIGAHHHRSGRGKEKIQLPGDVVPIPALFQKAGYHTAIGGPLVKGEALGKTDYNFDWNRSIYDGNDWSGRAAGQPFFMQVQLHGGKYREGKNWSAVVRRELGEPTRTDSVKLPPYYPRDPLILEDWAAYLDAVRYTDKQVGEVLRRLDAEGLRENTVIAFMTDHGISHARGKQFLYDEGIHVPLVLSGPGIPRGAVRDDLVSHIDLAATSLALAGIPVPPWMQGRDLLARDHQPRDAVFSARDRCDETVDRIRSVRTSNFKYIRNFYPERPHLQPNRYKDAKPIVAWLRALRASGGLDALQERLLFAPKRPAEELYDLEIDPWELKNLADDPSYRDTLNALRDRLDRWVLESDDRGRFPESEAIYDSDMAVYLNSKAAAQDEVLKANVALMKSWAAQGK